MGDDSGVPFYRFAFLFDPWRRFMARLRIELGKLFDRECDLVRGYQSVNDVYQIAKGPADTAVDDSPVLSPSQKEEWKDTRPEYINA